MEYWNDGIMEDRNEEDRAPRLPIIPAFQYSTVLIFL
jgi:hypothetical protein